MGPEELGKKSCGDQLRYWFGSAPYTDEVGFVVGGYRIKRIGGKYVISELSPWTTPIVTPPTLDAAAAWLDLTS